MAQVIMVKTLAAAAGVDTRVEAPGETIGEVLTALCASHETLGGHLLHANGAVKGHVLLSVDGRQVDAASVVRPDDELHILLATAGGLR